MLVRTERRVRDYATSIVDAIEACKVFILILSEKASNSPHVLNEVEMAYKRIIEVAKDVLKWIDEHYDDLEERFFDMNFLFHSGYFIYTVRF